MKAIYVDDEKPALVNFQSAVKNIEEIKSIDFSNINTLGITAGASTPNLLVDEIIKTIKDSSYTSNITLHD